MDRASQTRTETQSIRSKSIRGLKSLGAVGLFSKCVGILGGVALARLLAPDDYGVFAIVGFLLGITRLLTDVGLGASIIQSRTEPDDERISSIFYFQNGLVASAILGLCLAIPYIPRIYPAFKAGEAALVYVLAIDFFLGSIKSIPQAVLSRSAEFREISRIELVEQLSYWGVALPLAWRGFGVWALAAAVVARSALGTLLFYLRFDWKPKAVFRFAHVREHLRFGVEYQLARIFDFARESITPTVISQLFGVTAVGYTSWALNLTRFPQFVVFALHRASMSWFSRLQDEVGSLASDTLKTIDLSCLALFPVMAALFTFSHETIHFVFSDKWLPAERILRIYSVNFALVAASYPLYTAAFSLGHTRFMAFKGLVLTLVEIGVTLALRGIGFEAVAVANLADVIVSLFAYLALFRVARGTFLNVFPSIARYALLSALASSLTFRVKAALGPSIGSWLASCVFFGMAYCALNLLLNRSRFTQMLRIVSIQTGVRIPGLA